jgi:hypothetical protein
MKAKYYFLYPDSEICHQREYFETWMRFAGLNEIEVFEAVPDKISGIFWCKEQSFCGDGSYGICGKMCKDYSPRNGKSGCCKHYTTRLYVHGNKVKITLKK